MMDEPDLICLSKSTSYETNEDFFTEPSSAKLAQGFKLNILIFSLKLKLKERLALPLCKGKFFRFQVKLNNKSEISVPDSHKFTLEAKLFTSTKPRQEITSCMNGTDIMKGTKSVDMVFDPVSGVHIANFNLKINDVSSHFSGMNLCIQAKEDDHLQSEGFCIKPLVIRNISIMSKEKICQKLRLNK